MADLKKNLGRVRIPWHYLLGLFLIASCANLCTKPCGTFTYTNLQVEDTPTLNGIEMTLDFDSNPADCGSACACTKVYYIQIVRGVRQVDGTYLYAAAEKQARATANGWYIDRVEGRKWGYYGRNDDGTFGTNLTPGSDLVNAQLYDFPKRPENET